MTTVREALAAATASLAAAGVPDAARDAGRLAAAALAVPPDRLTLAAGEELGPDAERTLAAMVGERRRRRPVAKIVGRRSFWRHEFTVDDHVLDPRPETEILVAAALAGPVPATILDLGTGTGAILLSLLAEWPAARGLGTDIDPRALAVATRNVAALGLGGRCALLRSDWYAEVEGRFDLVVSNPPYIAEAEIGGLSEDVRAWEPRHALTPGPSGLEAYATLAAGLRPVLAPGGRALFEIGPTQGTAVAGLLAAAGFGGPTIHRDLDGRERAVEVGG
jgi:release factor glutamine methyltransferase